MIRRTAHAYVAAIVDLLADRAPGLLCTLREADPDCILMARLWSATGCESWGNFSHKHRRYGVNVQVVTDPAGRLLWILPGLPGRAHDLIAACTYRIILSMSSGCPGSR
jgi:hypothetical protein